MVYRVPVVLLNGTPLGPERAQVSVFDRGFQYGDGVFETLAVVAGRVLELDAHLERLAQGAHLLGFPSPDQGKLAKEVQTIATAVGAEIRTVVKVIYTRGSGGRGLAPPQQPEPNRVILRLPWPAYPSEWAQFGVRIRLCQTQQINGAALDGRIKSLNQLNRIVARMEWTDDEVAEGLLRDSEQRLVEGTTSNLFLVRDGVLLTPELSDTGLPGITRRRVMELAKADKIPVYEGEVDVTDLRGADEVFLTNSLIGIWPVRQLENKRWPAPGVLTRRLQRALANYYGVVVN